MIVNKKRTYWIVDFVVPADHRVKLKNSEKKDKYLYLVKDPPPQKKKIMEYESDVI